MCTTPACIKLSAQILSSMDRSVQPCENFYEFTCGNYLRNAEDSLEFQTFGEKSVINTVQKKNDDDLKRIFTSKSLKSDLYKKAFDYYGQCMDHLRLQGNSTSDISDPIKIIKDLFEFSDITVDVNNSELKESNLFEILRNFSRVDASIFDTGIDRNPNNPKELMFVIGPLSAPVMESRFLETPEIVAEYKKMIEKLSGALGISANSSKIVEYEQFIARNKKVLKLDDLNLSETNRNVYLISEFEKKYPDFDFKSYLTKQNPNYTPTLPKEAKVSFLPTEMKFITDLLKNSTMHPLLFESIKLQLLTQVAELSNPDITKILTDFYDFIYKTTTQTKDQNVNTCISTTRKFFPEMVNAMYISSLKAESLTEQIFIAQSVKNAFQARLENNQWLDSETKRKAIEKLKAMDLNIGYPKEFTNKTYLENKYKNYDLTHKSFIINSLSARMTRYSDALKMLVDRDVYAPVWPDMQVNEVNAAYEPTKNSIFVPRGIWGMPFYDKSLPNVVSFGSIGSTIGHEITHGFDNNGKNYDLTGQMKEWWSEAGDVKFKQKTKCFVDQYSGLEIKVSKNTNVSKKGDGDRARDPTNKCRKFSVHHEHKTV